MLIKRIIPFKIVAAAASAILGFALVRALMDMPTEALGLTSLVKENKDRSGVEHPVTAVLLNFRGYDTWLEIGVLMLAVMGMLIFQRRSDLLDIMSMPDAEPVLDWLIKLLVPMIVLVGGYLLWMGKFSSGGAFQSGVVLGSAGVLLWLSGHRSVAGLSGHAFRFLLVVGFASFMVVSMILMTQGRVLLDFPEAYAGDIILFVEAAATLSIAVTVAALIVGLQPIKHTPPNP